MVVKDAIQLSPLRNFKRDVGMFHQIVRLGEHLFENPLLQKELTVVSQQTLQKIELGLHVTK